MYRRCLPIWGFFLLVGLLWLGFDQVMATLDVASMSSPGEDIRALESNLIFRGTGSIAAAQKGLQASDAMTRLHCARVLAFNGFPEGDRYLLKTLHEGRSVSDRLLAENHLLAIWDLRGGPPAAERAAAYRLSNQPADPKNTKNKLDQKLTTYPAWTGGYLARARMHMNKNDMLSARRDALTALMLEPQHFEATVLLARCCLLLDYYEHAEMCFEQALRVNPQLRDRIRAELEEARAKSQEEQQQRRKKSASEWPLS